MSDPGDSSSPEKEPSTFFIVGSRLVPADTLNEVETMTHLNRDLVPMTAEDIARLARIAGAYAAAMEASEEDPGAFGGRLLSLLADEDAAHGSLVVQPEGPGQ